MIRAFLALPLPDAVIAPLSLAQSRLRLPVPPARPVARENLHLTLVFLGEQRPDMLEALHEELALRQPAGFTLRLDGLGVFGGDRPHNLHARVAPEPALSALQARLDRAARMQGMRPERRRFTPHVTLARLRPGDIGPAALAGAIERVGALDARPFAVDRFALFRSHLRRDGAQYDMLAEYPLLPPHPLPG